MQILVVTGGIGSGKSEVCRIMRQIGIERQYDADSRVKSLYTDHPCLLKNIEESLGCRLRSDDGNFIPSRLAEKIFSDTDAMNLVEELVFPALLEDFEEFCRKCEDGMIVVFESATVLEKPQFAGFGDYVLLVDAPFEVRLERACRRDGADKDKILARMRNQKLMNALSEGSKDPRINAVIRNDGTFEELRTRTIDALLSFIKEKDINMNILTDL